jgi:hypothetical protein
MRLGELHWSWSRKRWMREEKQMEVRMRYVVEMPSWKSSNRI